MVNYQDSIIGTTLPDDREARRAMLARAYRAGDRARDDERISPQAHRLYEWSLRLCRAHPYIWAGLEKIAAVFHTCQKTISRWFKELVAADLVWRDYAPNRNATTWITVLGGPRPEQAALFLTTDVPTDGTQMSRPPIEIESSSGGETAPTSEAIMTEVRETPSPPMPPAPSPAVAELRAAGLVDEGTIAELATHPESVIRQAVAYVQRQGKGPGLIAWLIRTGLPIPDPTPRKETAHVRSEAARRSDRRKSGRRYEPCPWEGAGASIIVGGIPDGDERPHLPTL